MDHFILGQPVKKRKLKKQMTLTRSALQWGHRSAPCHSETQDRQDKEWKIVPVKQVSYKVYWVMLAIEQGHLIGDGQVLFISLKAHGRDL